MEATKSTSTKPLTIDAFTIDTVESVYSGRPGCMCGCRGNHRYASMRAAAASERRGCDVDVNDAQVKRVLKILRDVPATDLEFGDRYVAAKINGRTYVAYLPE